MGFLLFFGGHFVTVVDAIVLVAVEAIDKS